MYDGDYFDDLDYNYDDWDPDYYNKPTKWTFVGPLVALAVCIGLIALIEWICPGTRPLLW